MKRGLLAISLVLMAGLLAAQAQSIFVGDARFTGILRDDATNSPRAYRKLLTLGSDVTDSSGNNTYTDCTGMSFSVTSGVRYYFSIRILYTSAANTTGSAWSLNGPTVTDLYYTSSYSLLATSRVFNNTNAYDTPAAAGATSVQAGNVAMIDGSILPSANGTVIVRFMTEVDTSAVVCKAGSYLEYWN